MKKLYLTICTIGLFASYHVFGQVVKESSLDLSFDFTAKILQEPPSKLFYEYEVEQWQELIKQYPFDSPGLADLAWKMGSTLEALFFLYDMSSNEKIAELYLSLTDDLINTRDDKKGILAWDGKPHKFWSSGNRYNYGYIDLYDQHKIHKGILEFKDAKLDECVVSIQKTSPLEFSIHIENRRDGKTYSVDTTNFESLENDITSINWESYVSNNNQNKVLNYIPIHREKTAAKPIREQRIASYYVPSIDVNAIHLNALIDAYTILLKKKETKKAKQYYKFIEESIQANNNLYLNENEVTCYFQYPENSKTFMGGSVVYPYNKQFAYVAMLSKWNKIARKEHISVLIEKWTLYFKSKLEKNHLGVTWRYWDDPTNTIERFETENYGGHDIKYLMTIAEHSDAFSNDDILEITKAITENLLLCQEDEVFHKTAFDFKWRDSGLVAINYLSLGELWPQVFECYELHADVDKMHWIDRVRMIYYFKRR